MRNLPVNDWHLKFRDDDAYARGPIEEAVNKAADTSNDWANPRTNSKTP